jgi:hypothetical protein
MRNCDFGLWAVWCDFRVGSREGEGEDCIVGWKVGSVKRGGREDLGRGLRKDGPE